MAFTYLKNQVANFLSYTPRNPFRSGEDPHERAMDLIMVADLTDEQRKRLREEAEGLKDGGVSPAEREKRLEKLTMMVKEEEGVKKQSEANGERLKNVEGKLKNVDPAALSVAVKSSPLLMRLAGELGINVDVMTAEQAVRLMYLAGQYGAGAATEALNALEGAVSQAGKTYVVKRGDTLSQVSQTTGIPLKKLLEMNPHLGGRENYIEVGEAINLDPETIPDWAKREATAEEKAMSWLIGLKWEMKQRLADERREEWDAKAVTIPLPGWGVRPSNWIYGTPEMQRLGGINRLLQKEVMPMAFDIGVGFVPVAGEVNDAIDTTLAATTGKDKWGKVVPKWMIPVMVVACLLPVVSTGLVKVAGKATVKVTTEVAETVGEKILHEIARYPEAVKAWHYLKELGVNVKDRTRILNSFELSTLHFRVADEATYGIRFYDGVDSLARGSYLFPTFTPLTSRESLALPLEWNKMTHIKQWKVREGTIFLEGKAAPQPYYPRKESVSGYYSGGHDQWWIPNPDVTYREP